MTEFVDASHWAAMPHGSAEHLNASVNAIEYAERHVARIRSTIDTLVTTSFTDITDAAHNLFIADQLWQTACDRALLAEELGDALHLYNPSGQLLASLLTGHELPDNPVARTLLNLSDAKATIDRYAQDLQARIPDPAALLDRIAVPGFEPVNVPAGDRIAATSLKLCSSTDLLFIIAAWDRAAIDWRSEFAVVSLSSPITHYLAAHHTWYNLGPQVEVEYDPMDLSTRVADQLFRGVTVDRAYTSALTSARTCPAVRRRTP